MKKNHSVSLNTTVAETQSRKKTNQMAGNDDARQSLDMLSRSHSYSDIAQVNHFA